MTTYSSSKFPLEIGENGWLKTSDSQYFAPTLDRDHTCDWLVIGSGFAGISAAKRLTELRSGDKIILIDAIGIGEGAAGQNSGFMIDVPHNINAKGDYLSSIKKDKDTISLNREAIEFSSQMVEEYDIPQSVYNKIGKLNGAATPKGISFNKDYKKQLEALGEDYHSLDSKQMSEITGSNYYEQGIYTPGTILIQPAEYIKRIVQRLSDKIKVFQNSPIKKIEKKNSSWDAFTSQGKIITKNIIFAVNGHITNFGFYKNQLIHIFTYSSLTKKFDDSILKSDPSWGLTSSNPIGTTVRKIKVSENQSRLLIRNTWRCRQNLESLNSDFENSCQKHRKSFIRRFPNLNEIPFEFSWGGRVCLSLNGAPAFGELDENLFSACCSNGLGTVKGTLAGKLIIDKACKSNSSQLDKYENIEKPSSLPPNLLTQIGANLRIKSREMTAGRDL